MAENASRLERRDADSSTLSSHVSRSNEGTKSEHELANKHDAIDIERNFVPIHRTPTTHSHSHDSEENKVSRCSGPQNQNIDDCEEIDLEKNMAALSNAPTNQLRDNTNMLDTVRSHVSYQDLHVSDNAYREQNPEQYLRFSPTRKIAIVTILSACSFLAPVSSTTSLPAMPQIAETFNTTGSVINASNAVYVLGMGLSSSFWGTFSQIYGRRPVRFFSNLELDQQKKKKKTVALTMMMFRCLSGVHSFSSYSALPQLCHQI